MTDGIMKKAVLILITVFSIGFSGNGGYSGGNLRIGMGPVGQSLGNAGSAYFNPVPSSIYYNPALLTRFSGRSFELGLNLMSLDRQFMFISYGMPLKGTAAIGAFYIKSGIGNIAGRDNTGEIFGNIDNSFHSIQVAFAKSFGYLSIGFSLKLMYELMSFDRYEYSGQGVAIDLGLLYKINNNIWIGAQIKDINGKLESNTEDIYEGGQLNGNRFPAIYKVGIGWQLSKKIASLYYDFEQSSKKETKHHLGIESAVFMDTFRLRLGLENTRATGGFQIDFKLWDLRSQLNYVYLPSVIDEGDSHAFSWIFHF
jgi:hypothetical protein